MVVASVALLVALGGTGIAAVGNVPLLSVGTPQLKNNAVSTPKLKSNVITSAKIKNGEVKPADLSAAAKIVGPTGPTGPAGPAGAASPGYVAAVSSQTSGTAVTTSSTAYVDLAGSSETFNVPAGETARIYAVFSAETRCSGGGAGSRYCGVRILVDGNELNPAVGDDFAFDSTDNGNETTLSFESHAIARSSETLSAGNHTVKAQIRTNNAATSFRVDDWALIVYRTKLG
jgi:hypothetical protein